MQTTMSALLALALLAGPAAKQAAKPIPQPPAPPARGLPPVPSDPAVMALARKAIGKPCHYLPARVGPEIADFTRLPPSVGQLALNGAFVFVRQRGAQRVAFLAVDRSEEDQCRIADVQPLPPATPKEAYLDCQIDDPNPKVIPPISHGLGLRQNGAKPLAAYLEVDVKRGLLTLRAGDDKRIGCVPFESGD